jgi:hypothetical protein
MEVNNSTLLQQLSGSWWHALGAKFRNNIMKIGNWEVTDKGIEWKGDGLNRFVIDKQTITETVEADDRNAMFYKWILLATEEDWLAEDDLYDLNFAFVYATAANGADFNYEIFDETLSYQYSQLDDEGDEDDDLADLEQQKKEAESERD